MFSSKPVKISIKFPIVLPVVTVIVLTLLSSTIFNLALLIPSDIALRGTANISSWEVGREIGISTWANDSATKFDVIPVKIILTATLPDTGSAVGLTVNILPVKSSFIFTSLPISR